MASISRKPNGRRLIQFKGPDGKRRTIHLGKVSQRTAEAIKVKVERLVAAAISGHAVDDETARWLAKLDSELADKLARAGLIPKRERATLEAFLDNYAQMRGDVKSSTKTTWRNTRRNLIEFFGPEKRLAEITAGDAEEWRLFLIDEGLADSTVRRRSGMAKQFFSFAVRKEIIRSDPFAGLPSAARENRVRDYFVTRAEAEKVLEACPDAQWRLLFALSRYGGLRCPSEHLALRWGDIDWEHGRMYVRSPKTEHHAGHDVREVPLFPELRPYLEEAFDLAEPGTEFVITRYRDTNANLRTQLDRIIHRAGLKPWPKRFQNLRSTRQTELEERFPSHVVCAWLGNSQPIARKHYLQVTEAHFAEALQNALQQPSENQESGGNESDALNEKSPGFQGFAGDCDAEGRAKVGHAGLEPATSSL